MSKSYCMTYDALASNLWSYLYDSMYGSNPT